jgi:sarcosine oxidase subunit beta
MAYEGYLYWEDWPNYLQVPDERGHAKFHRSGMVIIKSEAQDFKKHLALHDELGIPYEVWDTARLKESVPYCEVAAYYPPKRPDDDKFGEQTAPEVPGAIFMPCAGYVNDPQLASHNLQRAGEAKGADFVFDEEVVEIRRSGGRVAGVTLKSGRTIDAPVVVNVSGPHSFIVNRMAGVDTDMNVTTRALRHEVHYLPFPEGYDIEEHGRFTSDDDVGTYSRPEVGGLLLVGSQDPACDPQEWIDDPDDFNREVTEDQWKAQVYRMALRMPSLAIPSKPKGIADLYDVTDDWIPIYDKSSLPGFYMAVGTSGNQFKNGPIAGLMMTELITACENGRDHDVDPVSIQGPYTGRTLNAGFYSRNREISTETSLSVLG